MNAVTYSSEDWVGSTRANLLAWWLPHAAIVAGMFVAPPVRTAIWTIALGIVRVNWFEPLCEDPNVRFLTQSTPWAARRMPWHC